MADKMKLLDENGECEVTKENRVLEENYEKLKKEIEEKSELMNKQLEDKSSGAKQIQSQMSDQLSQQEKDIKKQIDLYKEEAMKKIPEEEELNKVLKEYKTRFAEFDKSIKQSKKTL